jgi:arylsulfatase A-like enzyme
MRRFSETNAFRLLALGVAATLLAGGAVAVDRTLDRVAAQDRRQPSIVLILTDDQRADTMFAMPITRRLLGGHGITYRNAFVVNSICCPSRASILTGQYSHTTGVWSNRPRYGGFAAFSDKETIATRLQESGYTTGHVGKYLNGYYGTYVPPGWDRWYAFSGKGPYRQRELYYDFFTNEDGRLDTVGHDFDDYSTDVLAERAIEFIHDTRGPLFLQFAPTAPHIPATPAEEDESKFQDLPPWRPPGYNEPDVSDKPKWVRDLRKLGPNVIPTIRRRQLQSLQPVDRAVEGIVEALRETGRLDNTLIVFTSDNGYAWGEHRWKNKQTPYEHDIRVPMIVRYDRLIEEARTDDHFVLNVDLAPTFAALAGVPLPRADGRSLIPLFGKPFLQWRTDFLIEHREDEGELRVPSYCGIRNTRFTYVRYFTLEEELYDLVRDPYQLNNVVRDRRYSEALAELRDRNRALCDPPPPDAPVGFPP